MLKNLGIVQACFHWPRFRCNCARKLGGRPLLEWVIRRVTDSMRPERLDWQRIAHLLDQQSALRSRMAALNRGHHSPLPVGGGC